VVVAEAMPATAASGRGGGLRKLSAAVAGNLLYFAFLAALPATLVALFNFGAAYSRADWVAWLTVAAGAVLLIVGALLATNVLDAREQLVAQLRTNNSRGGRLARLTARALKMVSVVWILLGVFALARGVGSLH
jgi:hypothetical protein